MYVLRRPQFVVKDRDDNENHDDDRVVNDDEEEDDVTRWSMTRRQCRASRATTPGPRVFDSFSSLALPALYLNLVQLTI